VSWQNPYELTHRASAVRWVTVAVFVVLGLAFFRVQVLGSDRYEVQSEENRLRPLSLPAPRGLLTDRNGVVLADNVPGYSIALLASSPDSLMVKLERLSALLPLDSEQVEAILQRYELAPTDPVTVLRDSPFEVISALEEQRAWHPGLVVQSDPKRRYPYSDVTAHLIGYVGEVSEDELQTQAYRGARGGTLVGRDGLEQVYDELLRGRDGVKFAEVDALGRTVREATEVEVLRPEPGQTVRSTIDIELQQYIADLFPVGRRGAVVAMDPATGEVLALYSAPSYDPNAFIGGYDPEAWHEISESEDFPLFNRATQARYAPASPWKLAVAAMALDRGVVTMESEMAMPCEGGMRYYNRYFRCWQEEGHGQLTLTEAIQHSCDVYFYQLGLTLGLSNLLHDGVALGFRERSGIDLPNEYTPQYPPSTEYYNRLYGPRGWTNAVALNLAIGQGENAQTLINMMLFYSMLANRGGVASQPHLVGGQRGELRSLGLDEQELDGLREALVAVVDRGTAAGAQIADLHIAGKTGTAQNPQGLDHGWFIAFAPVERPQIVVGAIVEFAEHGSSVAPMVTRIVARHLLGPDAVPTGRIWSLEMPADSAPEPVDILPDTSLLRGGTTQSR
jgi:penicillin-binding protein 2